MSNYPVLVICLCRLLYSGNYFIPDSATAIGDNAFEGVKVDLFPHTYPLDFFPCTVDIQAIVSFHTHPGNPSPGALSRHTGVRDNAGAVPPSCGTFFVLRSCWYPFSPYGPIGQAYDCAIMQALPLRYKSRHTDTLAEWRACGAERQA